MHARGLSPALLSAARIPVGIAMAVRFTAPVLVALWVRFVRGTRLPAAVWFGIAVAVTGLAVVAEVWRDVVAAPPAVVGGERGGAAGGRGGRVLAWWLPGEVLTAVQVIGAAVLLAGAAVVRSTSGREAPVTPEPVPRP